MTWPTARLDPLPSLPSSTFTPPLLALTGSLVRVMSASDHCLERAPSDPGCCSRRLLVGFPELYLLRNSTSPPRFPLARVWARPRPIVFASLLVSFSPLESVLSVRVWFLHPFSLSMERLRTTSTASRPSLRRGPRVVLQHGRMCTSDSSMRGHSKQRSSFTALPLESIILLARTCEWSGRTTTLSCLRGLEGGGGETQEAVACDHLSTYVRAHTCRSYGGALRFASGAFEPLR